jgi:hypothetical protein
VAAVFGFAFALIGVLVFGNLWLEPFGFMHTPLFFRLFGSVIALVFVVFGGTLGTTAIRNRPLSSVTRRGARSQDAGGAVGYQCPSCGAGLSDSADVSPSGDAKCAYCRTWFNVHR